jgi:hypothetical protein
MPSAIPSGLFRNPIKTLIGFVNALRFLRVEMCGLISVWTLCVLSGCPSSVRPDGGSDGESDVLDARVSAHCGTQTCADGESCCLTTGVCFDSLHASQCPNTSADGGCAANSDCPSGEYCASDQEGVCLGAGHCVRVELCGRCPAPDDVCEVCGCDGLTYQNPIAACRAGVRVVAPVACRTSAVDGGAQTFCGSSDQCPTGQECCGITARCYDVSCSTCCRFPPDGSRVACMSTADCYSGEYCAADACGAPGGCVRRPGSATDCGGIESPVCGCDGQTYMNECWAHFRGVQVAMPGPCP